MKRTLVFLMWFGTVGAASLLSPASALAQHGDIQGQLAGLAGPEPEMRSAAFRALLAPFNGSGRADAAVAQLLAANPSQADEIKIALFATLEREAAYSESLIRKGETLPEELLYYCDSLGQAVGSLRDPRALRGLLAVQATSGIDPDFIADLCPGAVDAIIAKSLQPEWSFQGEPLHVPGRAVVALGECLKRAAAMKGHPDAVTKIRARLLDSAANPDFAIRQAAVEALFPLRSDPEVRSRLELVASSDPFSGPIQPRETQRRFWLREEAAAILNSSDGDKSWYVMRTDAQTCRIQLVPESSVGGQYLGPFPKPEDAKRSMCNHVDLGTRSQSLCLTVEPANSCAR